MAGEAPFDRGCPLLAGDAPFGRTGDAFRSFRSLVGTMGAACGPYDGRCLLWLQMPLEMPHVVGDALFDRGCPHVAGDGPFGGTGDAFRSFRPQVGTMSAACGTCDGRCLLWLEKPSSTEDAPICQGMPPFAGRGMPYVRFTYDGRCNLL